MVSLLATRLDQYMYVLLPLHLDVNNYRPTLKHLNKIVRTEVAIRWYDLGLELLDSKHEYRIQHIKVNHGSKGVEVCCQEMFSEWLATSDDVSWNQLILALETIGLNSAANDVKQLSQSKSCS